MKKPRLYIIAALVTLTFSTCSKSEDNQPSQQQQQEQPSSGENSGGNDNENPEGNPGGVENVNNDYSDQPAYSKHI